MLVGRDRGRPPAALLACPAVLARLHELAAAEEQLSGRQAALRDCEARLRDLAAAASSYKK